jgi:hypothetical protein
MAKIQELLSRDRIRWRTYKPRLRDPRGRPECRFIICPDCVPLYYADPEDRCDINIELPGGVVSSGTLAAHPMTVIGGGTCFNVTVAR